MNARPARAGPLAARTVPGLHATLLDELTARVAPGAAVLDLGAGTGAWAGLLVQRGFEVQAIERDVNGFELPGASCIAADLNEPFAHRFAAPFDALSAVEVIEHLENPRAFLRECKRLLKPEGLLFLTTPNIENVPARLRYLATGELRMFGDDPRFNDPTHITPIHSGMLRRMLRDVGLELREHRFSAGESTPSRFAYRAMTALLAPVLRGIKGGDCHIFVIGHAGK